MRKGSKHTIESINQMKNSLKGRLVWNKGLKGATTGSSTSFKKGHIPWHSGKKGVYSKLTIERMSKKKIGIPSWNKGIPYYSLRGVNHPNWKGGISTENEKIRGSLEIRIWRRSVLERDNFTCQKTGQKGGKLIVHHINNFSNFPELRTSIENGVILSEESHKDFHKKYGKKNNTREQLIEFLQIKNENR